MDALNSVGSNFVTEKISRESTQGGRYHRGRGDYLIELNIMKVQVKTLEENIYFLKKYYLIDIELFNFQLFGIWLSQHLNLRLHIYIRLRIRNLGY